MFAEGSLAMSSPSLTEKIPTMDPVIVQDQREALHARGRTMKQSDSKSKLITNSPDGRTQYQVEFIKEASDPSSYQYEPVDGDLKKLFDK